MQQQQHDRLLPQGMYDTPQMTGWVCGTVPEAWAGLTGLSTVLRIRTYKSCSGCGGLYETQALSIAQSREESQSCGYAIITLNPTLNPEAYLVLAAEVALSPAPVQALLAEQEAAGLGHSSIIGGRCSPAGECSHTKPGAIGEAHTPGPIPVQAVQQLLCVRRIRSHKLPTRLKHQASRTALRQQQQQQQNQI